MAKARGSYRRAFEKFIAWYCSEPRPAFERSVVVRYRSFLEPHGCSEIASPVLDSSLAILHQLRPISRQNSIRPRN
jgi:hypothetical protein